MATYMRLDPKRREYTFEVKLNLNLELKINYVMILPEILDISNKKFTYLFQIFGFDYMIDENFKPWLIEVNTNPDITIHNPICGRVIPPMVENALR